MDTRSRDLDTLASPGTQVNALLISFFEWPDNETWPIPIVSRPASFGSQSTRINGCSQSWPQGRPAWPRCSKYGHSILSPCSWREHSMLLRLTEGGHPSWILHCSQTHQRIRNSHRIDAELVLSRWRATHTTKGSNTILGMNNPLPGPGIWMSQHPKLLLSWFLPGKALARTYLDAIPTVKLPC